MSHPKSKIQNLKCTISFTKMVGTGNDFLLVDVRARPLRVPWPAVSRKLCDRRNGIGADGLLILEPSAVADVKMRIFNPDGSEADMCGNGARCVALYERQAASSKQQAGRERHVTIETKAGVLSAAVRGDRVALRMTEPTRLQLGRSIAVEGGRVRFGFVNTGVPHVVVPVKLLDTIDVPRLGRALRRHRQFAPDGANVDFIQPDPRRADHLRVRTYERGVEEETLACGTGIAASAIVHALSTNGKASRSTIHVHARSGDLLTVSFAVERCGARRCVSDVVLEGPARRICDGTVSVETVSQVSSSPQKRKRSAKSQKRSWRKPFASLRDFASLRSQGSLVKPIPKGVS